jgi:hypothetical protein
MNTVTRSTAILCLSFLATAAVAGGDAWPFRVVGFEQGWFSRATFVLEHVPSHRTPPTGPFACTRITVLSRYARPGIFRSHPPEATRKSHVAATGSLRTALSNSEIVKFGLLGKGLVPALESGPCTFHSRALLQLTSEQGTAILSLHNAV